MIEVKRDPQHLELDIIWENQQQKHVVMWKMSLH